MVVVDSTVWIDYLRGKATPESEWLDREIERQPLGLIDLSLCEILQGISTERQAARVERDLLEFQLVETGSADLAIVAARHYRTLRRRGRTVRGTIDCLIATACLVHGYSLLHNDRDFDAFEDVLGLSVVHP